MQLVSKISNLCDHKSPTLLTDRRTDGQTDRRHAIARPRKCTKVHCAVIKSTPPKFIMLSNIYDLFSQFFSRHAHRYIFNAMKWSLRISSNLKRIVALPCKIMLQWWRGHLCGKWLVWTAGQKILHGRCNIARTSMRKMCCTFRRLYCKTVKWFGSQRFASMFFALLTERPSYICSE